MKAIPHPVVLRTNSNLFPMIRGGPLDTGGLFVCFARLFHFPDSCKPLETKLGLIMADIYIVKMRVRFSAMLLLVLTLLGGLATWHFWNQVQFEQDTNQFLLSAVVTGALALGTIGLFIFYLFVQYAMTPSRTITDAMDAVPWWLLKVMFVLTVIGIAAFFVLRYRNLAEDEFELLRKGRLTALETRIQERPVLLERRNSDGLSLLQVAYLENHPEGVRLLVSLGVPATDLDPSGRNPVIGSMFNQPMLEALLDSGLSPSVTDADGTPALHHAVRMTSPEVLELLIAAGVDLNERNGIYRTALMQCIEMDNFSMAGVLVENGADLDAFDQRGDTALHIAVRRRSEKGVRLLLENEPDATIFNFIHMTPLHMAAQAGLGNLVKLLADYVQTVDLVDEADRTPFEMALTNRKYETATMLIDYGADINRVMTDGKTLMHLEVNRKDYAIVRFLLRAGARADIPDRSVLTVLDICKAKELEGLVEMIEGTSGSNAEEALEN